jgi:hypothetical protein
MSQGPVRSNSWIKGGDEVRIWRFALQKVNRGSTQPLSWAACRSVFWRPHRCSSDYLFWRVSEGGMMEPFKSMKSAMPAFKTILSEDFTIDTQQNAIVKIEKVNE